MRGSLEHLLLQEAKVLTKGRKVSRYRKKFEGAENLESGQGTAKPGGREGLENTEREERNKVQL